MAQVHHVKAAAKDYPMAGIKKGEEYYWWQSYRGQKQMSKTRPKASQVASGDYARGVLALIEGLEEWGDEAWGESERDELVSALEEIRDAEQEKFDNMPEGFQMGETGQNIEQHVNDLDEWISDLEDIDFEDGSQTALEKALETSVSV